MSIAPCFNVHVHVPVEPNSHTFELADKATFRKDQTLVSQRIKRRTANYHQDPPKSPEKGAAKHKGSNQYHRNFDVFDLLDTHSI